jgi:hypothetical protein
MQFRNHADLPHFSYGPREPRFLKPGLKSTQKSRSHSPQIRGSQFTKAPFVIDEGSFQFTVCKFAVHGSPNHQSPFHLSSLAPAASLLTSHFSHHCAAAAAPALVFLQSQIVADPTKRITPSARKHSLYAITYEFV